MTTTACDDQFNDPPIETSETEARPYQRVKCDGNHGGPRCADPECWNDTADEVSKRYTNVDEMFADMGVSPSGQSAALSFADALRIARGCKDYGGGYRYEPDLFKAYQAGISTVIVALTAAGNKGLADSQVRALHSMGAQPDAANVRAAITTQGETA